MILYTIILWCQSVHLPTQSPFTVVWPHETHHLTAFITTNRFIVDFFFHLCSNFYNVRVRRRKAARHKVNVLSFLNKGFRNESLIESSPLFVLDSNWWTFSSQRVQSRSVAINMLSTEQFLCFKACPLCLVITHVLTLIILNHLTYDLFKSPLVSLVFGIKFPFTLQ